MTEDRSSKPRIVRIVLWAAAAAAVALVLELVFFLSLTSATARARLLAALPDRIERSYIGFVLGDGEGYFRSAPRKCGMIELLQVAQRAGIRLAYDPARLIPYAGHRAVRGYDEPCIEEPTRPRAGRLLFAMGNAALVRRGFAAHEGDQRSVDYLWGWFDAANVRFPGYAPLLRRHCSPFNTDRAAWEAATGTPAPSLPGPGRPVLATPAPPASGP